MGSIDGALSSDVLVLGVEAYGEQSLSAVGANSLIGEPRCTLS